MKAEALAVIRQVEETKRQLDSMGQPFDRPWMRRVQRLRSSIGEQLQPAGRRLIGRSYTR
jgi:hypothetical protein